MKHSGETFEDNTEVIEGEVNEIGNDNVYLIYREGGKGELVSFTAPPIRPGDRIKAHVLYLERCVPKNPRPNAPLNDPEFFKSIASYYVRLNRDGIKKASKIELIIDGEVRGTWGKIPTGIIEEEIRGSRY